jgi:hypothetical protein
MIHFYTLKKEYGDIPILTTKTTNVGTAIGFVTDIIRKDAKKQKLIEDISNKRRHAKIDILAMFVRAAKNIEFHTADQILFENKQLKQFGLIDLLRLYYMQFEQEPLPYSNILTHNDTDISEYADFAHAYASYYLKKYENPETGALPYEKFKKHVLAYFPAEYGAFIWWYEEAVKKVNAFLQTKKWDDCLLFDGEGEKITGYARFTIEFLLNKEYYNQILKHENII